MIRCRPQIAPVLLGLLLAMVDGARAETSPEKGSIDSRIRTASYSDQEVYRLRGVAGYEIDLQFEAGEKFLGLGAGDIEGLSFVAQDNHLFLKAKALHVATNLTVLTTRRQYQFDYSSVPQRAAVDSADVMYALRFVYPPPPDHGGTRDDLDAALRAGGQTAPNTAYWYCGHPSLQPVAAFDDGVHTHLRFGSQTELPVIFVLGEDGGESLLNFHVDGGDVVIHRTARRFVLRRGSTVGCVVNAGFAGSGRRLESGTVAPAVTRQTVEATHE